MDQWNIYRNFLEIQSEIPDEDGKQMARGRGSGSIVHVYHTNFSVKVKNSLPKLSLKNLSFCNDFWCNAVYPLPVLPRFSVLRSCQIDFLQTKWSARSGSTCHMLVSVCRWRLYKPTLSQGACQPGRIRMAY